MRFDIITIFPQMSDSYLEVSMIKRGIAKKLIDIRIHNLRDFGVGPHRKVDDRPYGGGPGMVIQVEPLIRCFEKVLKSHKPQTTSYKRRIKIILLTPGGRQFDARMAKNYAEKYDRIVMIAGHYEGIDARIGAVVKNLKCNIENVSIGPYVLTGGELPAMVVIDAVSRHIPGFLGKAESLEESRYGAGLPVYSRPEIFIYKKKKFRVPKVLLSGNHKRIDEWRKHACSPESSRPRRTEK